MFSACHQGQDTEDNKNNKCLVVKVLMVTMIRLRTWSATIHHLIWNTAGKYLLQPSAQWVKLVNWWDVNVTFGRFFLNQSLLTTYFSVVDNNMKELNKCCLCAGVMSWQCILLLSLINFTPLKYNTYQYPWWAYALGISFALISVVLVPLWAFYILAVTPGTLRQVTSN